MPDDSEFRFTGLLGDDSVRFDADLVMVGGSGRLRARVEALPAPVVLQEDAAGNDSDKVLTVPAGKVWRILWARYEFTATATAGTRKIRFEARDASDNVLFRHQSNDITAGQSAGVQLFRGGGGADGDIPARLFLPAGFDVRVHDVTAVDPTADDLIVRIMTEVFPQ